MTDFEISRPVLGGAEDFLNVARFAARQIFGEDITNGVLLAGESRLSAEGINEEAGEVPTVPLDVAGSPRALVYSKLMLPLVQLAAPIESNANSLFHKVAARLSDRQAPAVKGAVSKPVPIDTEIQRAGLAYDIVDQNSITINCSGIAQSEPPHKVGKELVLVLDPAEMISELFFDENRIILQAMRRMAQMRGKLDFDQRYLPQIPFMWLPHDTTTAEQASLVQRLQRETPLTLRLGAILSPLVR